MGSKIFISYRRVDAAATCGRIYDRLVATFGKEAVFKDVDAIPYGVDFRTAIRSALDECAVQLVVIGPQWLDVKNSHGQRRLDDVGDAVRFEVETALQRGLVAIPVLVQGASVPSPQQLPPSLQQLAFRNALELRFDPDFDTDMHRLLNAIERFVPALPSATPKGAASAKPQVPRIARQPAKLGTLARWGLAFGAPLAFVEALLAMTAKFDTNFNNNTLETWLVPAMFALALAVFFVIGLFVARRTGDVGSGFFSTVVAAILTSVVFSLAFDWSDGVEKAAQPGASGTSIEVFSGGLLTGILLLILLCAILGIVASAIGGVIGKHAKPPAVERLARSRVVLRVGIIAGLCLTMVNGILGVIIESATGTNDGTLSGPALVAAWMVAVVVLAGLFLAGLFAGRGTRALSSGLLAALLTGVVAGMGSSVLLTWEGSVHTGAIAPSGNSFVQWAFLYSLIFALVGLIAGLLPGVIGGAIGQSLGAKIPAGPGSTGGGPRGGAPVVSEPVRAAVRRVSAPR